MSNTLKIGLKIIYLILAFCSALIFGAIKSMSFLISYDQSFSSSLAKIYFLMCRYTSGSNFIFDMDYRECWSNFRAFSSSCCLDYLYPSQVSTFPFSEIVIIKLGFQFSYMKFGGKQDK